ALLVVQRTGPSAFGPVFAEHPELVGSEHVPPFLVGFVRCLFLFRHDASVLGNGETGAVSSRTSPERATGLEVTTCLSDRTEASTSSSNLVGGFMDCVHCGRALEADASFCSSCGHSIAGADAGPRKLYRRAMEGRLGGVCAGLAEYLNVDVTLVRL